MVVSRPPRAPCVPATPVHTSRLAQHMINDSASWGSVDDPIGTLLRRAAFFVVEHPSPASRAELAAAREQDLVAKVQTDDCRFQEVALFGFAAAKPVVF